MGGDRLRLESGIEQFRELDKISAQLSFYPWVKVGRYFRARFVPVRPGILAV